MFCNLKVPFDSLQIMKLSVYFSTHLPPSFCNKYTLLLIYDQSTCPLTKYFNLQTGEEKYVAICKTKSIKTKEICSARSVSCVDS